MPLTLCTFTSLSPVCGADCVGGDPVYVLNSRPGCCSTSENTHFAELAKRNAGSVSTDLLLEELATLQPAVAAFGGIQAVATRPRFTLRAGRMQSVWIKMVVNRLFAVDQKTQKYSLSFDLYLRWRDCRLLYDSAGLDGPIAVTDETAIFNRFWKPVVRFEEEDPSFEKRLTHQSLFINHDGMVTLKSAMTRSFACSFDFSELPFDVQKCNITMSVPEYISSEFQLEWDPTPLSLGTLTNKEWNIAEEVEWFSSLSSGMYASQEPGPRRTISSLSLSFSMKRYARDYSINYILPALVYWLCSYSGFWVDPEAVPGRVALGLIPILTMNNKMGQLRNALPPVNTNFRLEAFMNAVFLLTIIHLVEFCAVHYAQRVVLDNEKRHKRRLELEAGGAEVEAAELDKSKFVLLALARNGVQRGVFIWARWGWGEHGMDFHARWLFPFTLVVVSVNFLVLR